MTAPLRFGILGAAGITPSALLAPAAANNEVEVTAVAARSRARAEQFAAEHGIAKVHDTYEDLLADPDLDAVYIPLPNSEHGRWTIAAVDAGKHVLVEKPAAANAAEATAVAEHVAGRDQVVMEAIHSYYHPIVEEVRGLIASGAIGELVSIDAFFDIDMPDRTNIRYQQDLAGGATMDLGCYCLFFVRAITGEEPTVVGATARPAPDPRLDEALTSQLVFPSKVTSTIGSSLLEPVERQSAFITGTAGTITVEGFVKPQDGNSITMTVDGVTTTHDLPSTPTSYDLQLAAFVDAVSQGSAVPTGPANAIAQLRVIDQMYLAAGLEPRA